jgi:tRNA A-37 threonylcarbamoyl transferase component Bud32
MTHAKYTDCTLNGKYRVQDLLGEGGMGSVYRGEHLLIGRKVAIKFLHESLQGNEEAVKRFYREGQAAASIRHRNVVDILDVGVSPEGEPYLVMEYLEGEGLTDLISRRGALDLGSAAGILEQVLMALGAAHERGIVHRDLKPDNIFLERQRGQAPGIKLIDFGISKLAREGQGTRLTRDGSMMGTPAYMSPEQIRNSRTVDQRTDIYAAGAILYEMLTGAPPFAGEQYSEVLSNVLTEPPRAPRELRADFPEEAWPLIERALAKDPAARFSSADEMLAALAGLVAPGERAVRLTQLGASMPAAVCAAGDLGPAPAAVGDTVLAAEILGRVSAERAGTPAWKRLARRVATEPKLRLRTLAAAAAGLTAVLLLAGLCSGGDVVTIEVVDAPAGARIYWEDSLVPANPFQVDCGDALRSLRVEAKGHLPLRLSVQPREDQRIVAKLEPEGRAKKAPAAKPDPAPVRRSDSAGTEAGRLGEPGASGAPVPGAADEKKPGTGSKPARKKRRFPKLPWQK